MGLLNSFRYKLKIQSSRTKNIKNHVILSFIYKGGSILANFLLVPLTIDYLDTENYGIWLTLTSFIAWFSFFDIGLGNGLRNKFAEARAADDNILARAFVSTGYYTIAIVSLLLFIIFLGINFFIDWTNVFNTSIFFNNELSYLMPIIFGFFCIQLVVKLITAIYLADQHHSVQVKVQFATQVLSLLIVWLLIQTSEGSLLTFGSIIAAVPVIILISLNLFAFTGDYKIFKPKFSLWKKEYLRDIMGIGFNFFIIQIATIVLYSTDSFIIIRLFGPEHVVPYNIAFKYFSIITMVYSMIVVPYWSSFTEAYIKRDYMWIKSSVKNILILWLIIPFSLIFMILIADWFYDLWIGEKVIVMRSLSISMALFVLLNTFIKIFTYFINGVGKIRLQLYVSIFSMIINVPLSVFFAKYLNIGIPGVILASCISLAFFAFIFPVQYYKIVYLKASGIWDK